MHGTDGGAPFDDWFREQQRPAILLHRPYPPHAVPPTGSKFGGLPRLPEAHDWPRTGAGTPLHFLAQIDCSDITAPGPLPRQGVLFFFGRNDEEQLWGNASDPHDDCRVIHAPDASAATPLRQVPPNLPPIGGSYPPWAWRDYLREGEPGPNIHVEWPLQPLPLETWPQYRPVASEWDAPGEWARAQGLTAAQFEAELKAQEDLSRLYNQMFQQRRSDALTAAVGRSAPVSQRPTREQRHRAAEAIFFHEQDGGPAYPQYWITIHYTVRYLLRNASGILPRHPDLRARVMSIAEHWLARSSQAGLDEPVSMDEREAFRAWLMETRDPGAPKSTGFLVAEAVFPSMAATLRSWAGDPARAARISPHDYATMEPQLAGYDLAPPEFAQMLGHASSVQEPPSPGDTTLCLLNLPSDSTLGWSFGDVGVCSFWIRPEDLERRDFSKAWGVIEGH